MSAGSALFLSVLVVSAIARQKTHKSFQKHVLLLATFLLVCAVISNVLINIFIIQPSQTNQELAAGVILTKRLQATFDYLFALAIGAFIIIATTRTIESRKDFARYMTEEFPNSYVYYVFIMLVALISIIVAEVTVDPVALPTVKLTFSVLIVFTNGLAVAAIILYAWFRVVGYLRRTSVGTQVRRGLYLIVLGVTGIAVGELLFEVVLPFYFIDLRAPGFIVEMAFMGLIAFAFREKSFLEELIVPAAEADLMTKPAYDLERGFTYAILEREANQAFEIFKDLVTHGAQGLCVTRRSPKSVMNAYGLERTPILWLSRVASEKNTVRPSPPENVAMAIDHFVDIGQRGVVLLDGFEYLVSHNDFNSVLALLHDLNEKISLQDAILLVPIDPAALNERELALIRREVRALGPLAYAMESGEKTLAR